MNSKVSRLRPTRIYHDQIHYILEKGQILGTKNRRICMKHCIGVEKTEEIFKDRIK